MQGDICFCIDVLLWQGWSRLDTYRIWDYLGHAGSSTSFAKHLNTSQQPEKQKVSDLEAHRSTYGMAQIWYDREPLSLDIGNLEVHGHSVVEIFQF